MRDGNGEVGSIPTRRDVSERQGLPGKPREGTRVLIAHNFYRNPGGEDRYVRSLASLLNESGYETSMLAFESRDMGRLTAAANLITQRGKLKQIKRFLEEFQPDIVHLHNPYPQIGAEGVRLLASWAPIVMTLHNYRLRCPNGFFYTNGEVCERCAHGSALNAARYRCLETAMQSFVYAVSFSLERLMGEVDQSVSFFVCPSPFMAWKMQELGIPPERLQYVPYFLEGDIGQAGQLGDYVLFVGRLSPEKGAQVVVDSARESGLPTVIVGDGPERVRLLHDAPENVRFCGWLPEDEVEKWMAGARVVVIPSLWYENLPMVFLSALGAGRPVVGSNTGSVGDLVDAYEVGMVFEHGSSAELTRTLKSVWDDEDTLLQWGRTGVQVATAEFSKDSHRIALDRIYGTALEIPKGVTDI